MISEVSNESSEILHYLIRIRLPCTVDRTLKVSELDEAVSQLGKVADAVEENPRGVVHSLLHAAVSHLLHRGIVRLRDELLEVS